MIVLPIKTKIFNKGDSLEKFIFSAIPELKNKSILLITSKIVSLAQSRTLSKDGISKKALVEKEADQLLGESYKTYLTIKDGILIPAAGIDESNAQDEYILWPKDSYKAAEDLWKSLRTHYKVQNLGIILTDSRCTPLRYGVTGIGIAHWGFKGIESHIGKKDLFGREIEMSTTNVVDSLASAGVLVMGESNESCPLAIITDYDKIEFNESTDPKELVVDPDQDIFKPLFKK